MAQIHRTAIVDETVELGDGVTVGAYSVIGPGVKLGPGTVIREHCHLEGKTTIGRDCKIGPAAYIGLPPQHIKFDGAGTALVVGDNVTIREMVSVHRSIYPEPGKATVIGNRCYLMASSHLGHDCMVGDDVILANAALLGGHCQVGAKVFIGGGATIHQFVRIGRLAIVSGNAAFTGEVPPFAAVRHNALKGYNAIGCKRSGMNRETIHAIRSAYHCIHSHRTVDASLVEIRNITPMVPEVQEIIDFITSSRRGILCSFEYRTEITSDAYDPTEEAE